jgi:hypothetical protein
VSHFLQLVSGTLLITLEFAGEICVKVGAPTKVTIRAQTNLFGCRTGDYIGNRRAREIRTNISSWANSREREREPRGTTFCFCFPFRITIFLSCCAPLDAEGKQESKSIADSEPIKHDLSNSLEGGLFALFAHQQVQT